MHFLTDLVIRFVFDEAVIWTKDVIKLEFLFFQCFLFVIRVLELYSDATYRVSYVRYRLVCVHSNDILILSMINFSLKFSFIHWPYSHSHFDVITLFVFFLL